MKKIFLGGVAFLLLQFAGHAQQPDISFLHISGINGLSQNQVRAIVQDQQGFMWFGTGEGLNRFDGYSFTTFTHKEGDSSSITNDFVNVLIKDSKGDLWIGTESGLNKYNRQTDSFTTYVFDPHKKNSISYGSVNQIIEDQKGNFWIAFSSGIVDYFDRTSGQFIHNKITVNGEATSLLEDRHGNIWIGTFQGITILNSAHIVQRSFTHDPANPHSLGNPGVNCIFKDSENNIWIATGGVLNKYNEHEQNFLRIAHSEKDRYSIVQNVIKCVGEDKEGRLWIGTENGGLDIWDRTNNKFYHFKENPANKKSVSDNDIRSIYRDKLDNMWVGTGGKGVNFYDRFMKPFVAYQCVPGIDDNISSNKVFAIAEQPGKGIWIATDGGGLNFFDPENGLFSHYRHQKSNPGGLPSDFLVDIVWDDHERCLWIATWRDGLTRFDPQTGRFKNYRHNVADSTSLASDNLWRLYIDAEGILYVGTVGGGLSIYDRKTDRFSSYSTDKGLTEPNVVSILRDTHGFLWLGGWKNGMSRMDFSTKKFVPLPDGIVMRSVYSITEDSVGRIWITGNSGILAYDGRVRDSVFNYSGKDGLPVNSVNSMLDDHHGNYWLSTNKGIVKFSVSRKTFQAFGNKDGLPGNQFYIRNLRASDGKMYFGSVDGLVVFHPDSIKVNLHTPPVHITDLKIFNKSVPVGGKENILSKSVSETKEIWLPYEYNFITLNFVALNFTSGERNEYAYQLEGFDKDWIYIGAQRSATYTSLDVGTYTFKVMASNNDGLWNEEGASLVIHILPPWWQTWWFRILVFFGILGIAILVSVVRTRNVRRINRELEEAVNQKTRQLQETNKMLLKHEEEINAQNEELLQHREEITAQRDLVARQNEDLIKKQKIIEQQNADMAHQNENLEEEVAKRTQELVEYNNRLEQFAFIAAHDLRAPVARILGLGHLLDHPENTLQDKEQIYPRLINTTKELDTVVRDLNTILQIKKNDQLHVSSVDLAAVVSVIRKNLEAEITTSRAGITIDFSGVERINTVKPYLDSILYNLISNAIKYRHPDRAPEIHIRTARTQDEICLSVTDNGLGIDTSFFHDKLFTLYSRFHIHVEGKGMGLYLVKTQMAALGGRIEVESEVDVGSTFRAYFKAYGNA